MTIYLNDKPHEVKEGTLLATFTESIGLKPQGIAIAIDYDVVSKEKWAETVLTDNLKLIQIQAVSGG